MYKIVLPSYRTVEHTYYKEVYIPYIYAVYTTIYEYIYRGIYRTAVSHLTRYGTYQYTPVYMIIPFLVGNSSLSPVNKFG